MVGGGGGGRVIMQRNDGSLEKFNKFPSSVRRRNFEAS